MHKLYLLARMFWEKVWTFWIEAAIIIIVVLFAHFVWPFPAKYWPFISTELEFGHLSKLFITIGLEIMSLCMIKPLKCLIYRIMDKDIAVAYKNFNNEFEEKIISYYKRKFFDKRLWLKGKTNLELILHRATSEIPEKTNRAVIDNFKCDITRYQPDTIIATNTSPLSLWFNHVITTYFIAQTKDLALHTHGLQKIRRYYLIKNEKLLDGIRYESQVFFGYWNAAAEIHRIAEKELYVIYKTNKEKFGFPVRDEMDDEKLLMFLKDNKIVFIRSFLAEDNHIGSNVIDLNDFSKYKTFIEDLESYTVSTTPNLALVHSRDDFLNAIANTNGENIVTWKVS